MISIIKSICDKKLFRPYLQDDNGKLQSWRNWSIALRLAYGLKVKPTEYNKKLVLECTGRTLESFDKTKGIGFKTVLLLVGRRGGKSKISGLCGAFEGVLSGREELLSKGEMGLVTIVSPTKLQSQIIKSYTRAALSSKMLNAEVVREENWSFELANGVKIQILSGDFRSIRGFSALATICDEVCYFGLSEESKIKSDTELIRAVRPGLATTGGKLFAVSTKYSRRGWSYLVWKSNFGNNEGVSLVWDAPSKLMNPTLDQSVIDAAMQEDKVAARSEFMNEWREDICIFLPREVIEAVVKKGRMELLPDIGLGGKSYSGFVDVSGGRQESSAMAIGHKQEDKVIIDFAKEYPAPHNPTTVIGLMSERLKRFKITRIVGDNYGGEFPVAIFKQNGIVYERCTMPKSGLYLEFIPTVCSSKIELLDNEKLIHQLSSLERKVRSGGRDIVDHPSGSQFHDDISNAVAGLSYMMSKPKVRVGGLW